MQILAAARPFLRRNRGNLRDIVFVHIPKTAGTSFRRILEKRRQDTELLHDYSPGQVETSPLIEQTVYADETLDPLRLRDALEPGRPITLIGHFTAARYAAIAAPSSFITFLRSPVERMISEFVHLRARKGLQGSIWEFAEARRDVQWACVEAVPLEQWGFIGTAENYDDDLKRLGRLLDLPLRALKLNPGAYDEETERLRHDPEVRRFIEERNEKDMALYRRVIEERDYFTRVAPRPETPPHLIRADATVAGGGAIEGYAVDPGAGSPVPLRLVQGGEELASFTADLYRPDLVGRFAPHGVGGFRLDAPRNVPGEAPLELRIGDRSVPVRSGGELFPPSDADVPVTLSVAGQELRAARLEDLAPQPDGTLHVVGTDPVIAFTLPRRLDLSRGAYVRCKPQRGHTILTHAEWEIVDEEGTSTRDRVNADIFLGRSQLLEFPRAARELRIHVGAQQRGFVPAALVLDPAKPFGLFRHLTSLATNPSGSSLYRKLRMAFELARAEGLIGLVSRLDGIGHGLTLEENRGANPIRDYAAWHKLYGPADLPEPAEGVALPSLGAVILGDGDTETAAERLAGLGFGAGEVQRAAAGDAALRAEGEWICVTDAASVLDPQFCDHARRAAAATGDDILYFDGDWTDEAGVAREPDFKPAWDEHLAFQQDYLGPLLVRRTQLDLGSAAGLSDSRNARLALVLAAVRNGAGVGHVDEVLVHRPMTDAAFDDAALAERMDVVRRYLAARGVEAEVAPRPALGTLQVTCRTAEWPRVSVIIPTRDNLKTLPTALGSVLGATDYPDLEIIVVDNGSVKPDTLDYLARTEAGDGRVRVVRHDHPFNFSELINVGARHSSGALFLLLNDDVEVIDAQWLKTMVSHFARAETGAVGAKLLFPDGKIQHAGVALGVGGSVAGHIYVDMPADTAANQNRAQLTRRVSAVTGACLLTSREAFVEIGGLDETKLKVAYNDIDYCLEVSRRGRQVIYEPRAVLNHYESHSRGRDNNPVKRERLLSEIAHFGDKWGDLVFHDPYYSGNFSLFSPHFRFAHPPRRQGDRLTR